MVINFSQVPDPQVGEIGSKFYFVTFLSNPCLMASVFNFGLKNLAGREGGGGAKFNFEISRNSFFFFF